jgi:molybdopterin-guanine dinucleotide biosynthesis protein A
VARADTADSGILTNVEDHDAFDALVLAGGRAHRLDGVDKPALDVGGRSLLDRVLAAVDAARRVVVVGPERPTHRAVAWCREDPPGGGPVAAIAAGLAHVGAAYVAVLAVDLPFVDGDVVHRLVSAAAGRDGAVLVDAGGRDQVLCAVYERAALAKAVAEEPNRGADAPLRRVVDRLDVVRLSDESGAALDVDTWDDLARAREEDGRAR